jgi:hypothetical protein
MKENMSDTRGSIPSPEKRSEGGREKRRKRRRKR